MQASGRTSTEFLGFGNRARKKRKDLVLTTSYSETPTHADHKPVRPHADSDRNKRKMLKSINCALQFISTMCSAGSGAVWMGGKKVLRNKSLFLIAKIDTNYNYGK